MGERGKGKASGNRNRRGDGGIYPQADGGFRVQIYIEGKLIRRRAPDRQTAKLIHQELIKLKYSDTEALSGLQSVEEFANYWFQEVYLQRGVKPRSAKHTIDMLQHHILPTIGKKALSDVAHAHLQKLLNDLRRRPAPLKPLSPGTVRHVSSVIKQLFSKAEAMNYIDRDPSKGLEVPKIRRTLKPALEVAEVRQLLAVADTMAVGARLAPVFHLLATLGLRIGEALGVRREDLSADFSTLTINQQISYHTAEAAEPKSDASRRVLPVPPRLAALLEKHWENGAQKAGLLFPTASGKPTSPRSFETLWAGHTETRKRDKGPVTTHYPGFKDLAELPAHATLHDLRKFVATTLESLDVGQRTIGHILGHSAGNVTELYIKQNLPTMRKALEKLEQALWDEAIEVRPIEIDQEAANYHSKLSDEQVREMRALWDNGNGLSHVEIGRRFGVSNVAAKNAIDSDRGR